jgi:hypothetical protein
LDTVLRLLVRLILVPLGYLAAVIAGACVILFGSWRFAEVLVGSNPDAFAFGIFGFALAGPVLLVMLLCTMWLPGAVGIVISEAFAIRSWIFHALNGAVSGWVGWQLFAAFDKSDVPLNEPRYVIAAGLAGGFAYWAVAGWSAGFWKPVFRRAALPPAPPTNSPFNPPAPTGA